MLRTVTLNCVSILLGLVANYNISIAFCPTLDGFNVAGDDASMLRFDFLPEMFEHNENRYCRVEQASPLCTN